MSNLFFFKVPLRNYNNSQKIKKDTLIHQKMGGGVVTVAGNSYKEQLQNAWLELQGDVNTFMDSSLNKLANEPLPGVRQLLEKKEGLFRKNMMGKRVDYACRSVISPDPFINTDEIGVPEVFASKLTYAQPVTPWNHKKLAQMVINGPNKYPGAVMIEYEDGRKVMLPDKLKEREAIAKQLSSSSVGIESAKEKEKASLDKKVYRHLLNGDVLLLNRQPTLHRPSIMAHKAKVLPNERTLRLHYANCKSYNADFDGDEMNAHFPQNELGRSEAYNIVSTNMNYLSPKDGKPLAGLIQDHIVSGVMMTARDRFFDREEYQQLVYSAFLDTPGRIKMLKPCIIKPLPKWSGKQVVSTIIINVVPKGKRLLNMTGGSARIADHSWPYLKKKSKESISSSHVNDPALTESQVIIREGELMTGILDKTQYGAASYGIVHSMYELYGGKTSGLLLSVFARLFTAFLQYTGFTLGIEDLLVVPHAESKRVEILQEAKHCGDESAMDALKLNKKKKLGERLKEAHHMNSGFELKLLDAAMKTRTDNVNNKVNTACMRGLRKKFPCNALQLMVQSGAKGSSVNAMQISCLLGQIELEGRRPPLSASGRSLPSFRPYDTSPRAGGFVDGRFLTGIRPQEYFFHCMAGREGLVDTAVKTSSSGYLQRCLIKHMEALYVQYDMTVRDGDGSVIQFLYGDDGIDVLNNQYLEDKQFKSILSNHQNYVEMLRPTNVSSTVDIEKAVKCQKKCDRWKRKHSEVYSSPWFHNRKSPFHLFEEGNRRKARKKHPNPTKKLAFSEADRYLFKKWGSSDGPTKDSIVRKCMPCPDPVLSRFNPACYFGAVSEKFHDDVRLFIDSESSFSETSTSQNNSMSRENFKPLMLIKFMRSLVEPGEAVGLLASQSIGEPSTQMTLNTFHFAGRGDMNVTLGIPRLREILMTASKSIKTPQMDVLVLPGKEEEARLISKKLNKLSLYKVLKNISVDEMLSKSLHDATTRCREFRVKLEFLPEYAYKDTYPTTPSAIIKFVETVFLKKIAKAVEKVILVKNKQKFMSMEKKRVNNTDETNEDESERVDEPMDEPDDLADLSDEEIEGDGDASNTKEKARKTQFTSYEQDDSYDDDANEADTSLAPDETTLLPTIKTEHEDIDYNQYDDGDDVNVKMEEEFQPTDEDIRIQNVLRRDRHIVAYLVDVDNLWCEVTFQFPRSGSKLMLIPLIEKLAEKAIIQESHGISRAMVVESKLPSENGRFRLKTEGININELWCHPNVLDVNSVYTNDIHIFSNTYGIEAARRVLIKEVEDVFKVYGIHINPRHLSLVGDYMTFEGAYKPFNRIGIETSAFPFQKMSFETSTHFLRHATAFGEPDSLGSPSSRIVVGRVIGTGTGMCDLLPDLSI